MPKQSERNLRQLAKEMGHGEKNPIVRLLDRRWPAAVSVGGGLQVTAFPSGRISWRYRYRFDGRLETMTLGAWPSLGVSAAKAMREKLAARVARGENPAQARRDRKLRRPSLEDFGRRWVEEVARRARKDARPVERILAREVMPKLGHLRVDRVTVEQVRELIFRKRDEPAPAAAAAMHRVLKRMFDYALVCGAAASNPVLATPLRYVARSRPRTRTLTAPQIRLFRQRLRSGKLNRRVALALDLILLTLCRKSELRLARWEHVDLKRGVWEVPAEISKSGLPHVVYLSRQAAERFAELKRMAGRARMVLPARDSVTQPITASAINKAIRRVKWGIEDFTPHDLRRTGSTILNELGYNPDWIEKALNHSTQGRGVRGVYNRAQYGEQRRQMLQEWADWLDAAEEG